MEIICIILCLIFIACIIKLLNDNKKVSKIIRELKKERCNEIIKRTTVEDENSRLSKRIVDLEIENSRLLKQLEPANNIEEEAEKLQKQVEVEKPKRTRKTTTTKKTTTKTTTKKTTKKEGNK